MSSTLHSIMFFLAIWDCEKWKPWKPSIHKQGRLCFSTSSALLFCWLIGRIFTVHMKFGSFVFYFYFSYFQKIWATLFQETMAHEVSTFWFGEFHCLAILIAEISGMDHHVNYTSIWHCHWIYWVVYSFWSEYNHWSSFWKFCSLLRHI